MRSRYKIKIQYFISIGFLLLLAGLWLHSIMRSKEHICSALRVVCKSFDMQIYDSARIVQSLEDSAATRVKHQRIADIDLGAISQRLRSLPWIKNVHLFFTPQHALEVHLYYRIPLAKVYFMGSGEYMYLADDGTLLKAVPHLFMQVPSIAVRMNGTREAFERQCPQLLQLLQLIMQNHTWNNFFYFVEIADEKNIIVHLKHLGVKVFIGALDNLRNKVRKLDVFYRNFMKSRKSRIAVIDVRFKNQLITRPGK